MSMRLGYDLKIEQSQKLVMTPELIQAIQILQFNTQELDSYVQEQVAGRILSWNRHSGDAGSESGTAESSGSRDCRASRKRRLLDKRDSASGTQGR